MAKVTVDTDAAFDWMNLENRKGALLLFAAVTRVLFDLRLIDRPGIELAIEELSHEASPERAERAMKLLTHFSRG